jgi:initiation factor 1A
MGRNTHGGSGHKKFARKHNGTNSGQSNGSIRRSESELEIYAIATRMLGNNMFHCHCIDNKIRLCHIRGRFDGRNKRNNTVSIGSWILVGLREWENTSTDSKKYQQCDLLEIYSASSKERLKDIEDRDWSILNANDLSKVSTDSKNDDNDDFRFETDRDAEINRLMEEMKTDNRRITIQNKNTHEDENQEDEEINIDDI